MPKEFSNAKSDRKEYPPTLEFKETGDQFILLAKEIRPNVDTKYGPRTVVECVERASKKRVSVWWPKDIPAAPVDLPFVLVRKSKKEWSIITCETREEAVDLWKTGEIKSVKKQPEGDIPSFLLT